jgi:beta-lactamase regulating signal transducer with metallopeptidase domain/HEAT repeat protein
MIPRFLVGIADLPVRDLAMLVLLVKATIILVTAFAITVAMQRASAGARHLVWLVALGTLLVVPALTAWAPIRLEILPAASAPSEQVAAPAAQPLDAKQNDVTTTRSFLPDGSTLADGSPAATPATVAEQLPFSARIQAMGVLSIALAVWGFVALVILVSLAWSALVVRRIVRQARPLDSEDWTGPLYEIADRFSLDEAPRLLRSDEAKMPFACGLLRATIVLPAESDGWSLDRRRAVLLHELAHVRRRDLVGHTLGRLACAFYWFHPLVWTAARELRSESERACDDLALSCGTRAADYAEHLLDIVTSIRRDATPSVALAMARRKEFEGRMLAILDPHLRRANPTRAQSTALIASLAVIALVVGAAAPARRVQGQSEGSQLPAGRQGAQGNTEQQYDQHSAPGGYDYRKISEKVTSKVTNKVSQKVTSRAVERALGPGGVADVDAIARAAANGSVSEMVRLLEAGGKGGAKDSDDRPILLAKVLRTDTSAALRRVAAWGLSEYADNDVAIEALANAVAHDKDAEVREMAAWALGDSNERGGAATAALAAALKGDASTKVRATAAWALGNIGDRSSVEALVAALGDSSPEVRKRAAWAIGNVEPHQAPPALIALLKDKDPETRELAAWGLYEIEDPAAAPALQAALKTETDKDLQLSYIRAMAAIGDKSIDAIRDLLESPDPRIKSMAVHALAGGDAAGPWPWPWPEPRPYPDER